MGAEDFVAELDALARAAGEAKAASRREAARRAAELERARAFAFRRDNVIKDVAAMRPHAEETAAVAAGLASLRGRFGWPARADGSHQPVLDAFRPVADFETALEALCASGLRAVPHIALGLHRGRLLGEWEALAIVARRREIAALVLVVVMPAFARGHPRPSRLFGMRAARGPSPPRHRCLRRARRATCRCRRPPRSRWASCRAGCTAAPAPAA